MQILVVSATYMEIAPIVAKFKFLGETGPHMKAYSFAGNDIDVLITGVGMMATAYWCAHYMTKKKYDLALNLGVCGSYDANLPTGKLVHIVSDRVAELGAEDGDQFLDVYQLNLLGENEPPFKWGQLVNLTPYSNPVLNALPTVNAISVNKVHGNETSIAFVSERFKPHVESMEGASFMYACLINELVFAQVRAISNKVERRNRDNWKMADAIRNLAETALELLTAVG
jgi:futalosine hydrolase